MQAWDSQVSGEVHPAPYPQHATAVIGSIGSGKSSLLLNVCLKGGWYRLYNRVVICAPTIYDDRKMMNLLQKDWLLTNIALEKRKEEEEIMSLPDDIPLPARQHFPKYKKVDPGDVHTTYSPEMIDEIIEWQQYHRKEYGEDYMDEVLLIFDDAVALRCFSKSHRDTLSLACTRCRSVHISIVFLSQYLWVIPPIIRTNLTAMYIFESSDTELKNAFELFGTGFTWTSWSEHVAVVTSKQHTAIQFNKFHPKGSRMMEADGTVIA